MEMLQLWRDVGVQYLSYSVDIGIFTEACENLAKKINGNNFKQNTEFLPGGGTI